MATYAIGDLQGCHEAFRCLLRHIDFRPDRDRLLLVGDLVARGSDSLQTLREVHALRDNLVCVLGNHDLHLLALAAGTVSLREKEADLKPILEAPDRKTLLGWLQSLPLLHEEPEFNAVLVHAGIPPLWTLEEARARAREVEEVLSGPDWPLYFKHMYGNRPAAWSDDLEGPERWRVITNHLTRMRFVDTEGRLELVTKGKRSESPDGHMPWFEHPRRKARDVRILFGHWAALQGRAPVHNIEPLDTGCCYGGDLTALRLEDERYFACECERRGMNPRPRNRDEIPATQ